MDRGIDRRDNVPDNDKPADLIDIRRELDQVDREIIALYKRRMALSARVAEIKIRTGRPVLDQKREDEKIEAVAGLVETDMDKENVEKLFRFLMSASRRLQEDLMSTQSKDTMDRQPKNRMD